jgi:hypothetical protein
LPIWFGKDKARNFYDELFGWHFSPNFGLAFAAFGDFLSKIDEVCFCCRTRSAHKSGCKYEILFFNGQLGLTEQQFADHWKSKVVGRVPGVQNSLKLKEHFVRCLHSK